MMRSSPPGRIVMWVRLLMPVVRGLRKGDDMPAKAMIYLESTEYR